MCEPDKSLIMFVSSYLLVGTLIVTMHVSCTAMIFLAITCSCFLIHTTWTEYMECSYEVYYQWQGPSTACMGFSNWVTVYYYNILSLVSVTVRSVERPTGYILILHCETYLYDGLVGNSVANSHVQPPMRVLLEPQPISSSKQSRLERLKMSYIV